MTEQRPRVAVIMTTWFTNSHAHVIAGRLIDGYLYRGAPVESRVEVVSAYLEQLGIEDPNPRPDIGVEWLERQGIPRFPTVAEALGLGGPEIAVDGVIIIGEHGDYEENEFGQKLYPRRRLFDAAVSTMIAAGRTVPIFMDKHLSWSHPDALAMYETSRRLGIPLLAGSSAPLAKREPAGADWPYGAEMSDCLSLGYGPIEAYGFHALESAQCIAERREGGETGVVSVRSSSGDEARSIITGEGAPADLFAEALGLLDLDEATSRAVVEQVSAVFEIEHADGLHQTMVMTEAVPEFLVAARGPQNRFASRMVLSDEDERTSEEFPHFTWLVRQIEALILGETEPYPVERTLLVGGVLDAAMRSRAVGVEVSTASNLDIAYRAKPQITDTGYEQVAGVTP